LTGCPLLLRLVSTEARANAADHDAPSYAERLPRLWSQLHLLEEAAATLFEDLESGRRRFVTYESLKLYGAEDPAQTW